MRIVLSHRCKRRVKSCTHRAHTRAATCFLPLRCCAHPDTLRSTQHCCAHRHTHTRARPRVHTQAARLWREVKAMGDLDFRFSAEAPAFVYAPALARRVQMYPPAEIMSAGSLLEDSVDYPLLRAF